jgi:hypothetical protein
VLLDRNGRVLVENQNIFNIALVREQTKNIDATLKLVAAATGVDEAQLRETVERRRREPSYRPIVLIENATREQVIAVWARRWEMPGSSTRKCRRGNIREPRPPTCSATSARSPRHSSSGRIMTGSTRARSSARPGSSSSTTSC